jgi:hypothetical protein
VEDPAGHAVIAARSNLCIVYCACRRRDGAAMTIAACVTQGDEDKAAARRNRRTAVVVSLLLLGAVLWLALVHGRRPAAGIVAPGAAPSSEPAGPGAVNSPSAPKPATP